MGAVEEAGNKEEETRGTGNKEEMIGRKKEVTKFQPLSVRTGEDRIGTKFQVDGRKEAVDGNMLEIGFKHKMDGRQEAVEEVFIVLNILFFFLITEI